MDKTTRRIIKWRKGILRKRLAKLPNFWWSIGVFVLFILLLILSFCTYEKCNWLSGVLVSASCGCFTGLIFYFLSNVRNNKEAKLKKEYLNIKLVYEILINIVNYSSCYGKYYKFLGTKRDVFEDGYSIMSLLDELEEKRGIIPLDIYDVVASKGYDPMDRDNINSYRDMIAATNNVKDMEKCILKIGEELISVADTLQELLQEREDQIMFIGKYFF